MSIALTNAVLLPFALALAVPLLIHLLARAKPPLFEFGSVELIERIVRRSIRARRPRDLLLLLIRTLLCAALVAVFLRPVWFPESRFARAGAGRNVVILVDATASMAYIEGSQTRFAQACADASEVLAGLGPNDRANLIWLRSTPTPVFPDLGTNHAHLRAILRNARPTLEPGRPRSALDMAAQMLEKATGTREVCIVSDFQASAWRDLGVLLPEGIDVIQLPAGAVEAGNCALTRIGTSPPTALPGEDVTVHCDVANFSADPKAVTVTLSAHGIRRQQETMLGPWETAIVPFVCAFDREGEFPVKASLGRDAFPPDNQGWGMVNVSPSRPAGLTPSDGGNAVVWNRLLSALENVVPEPWPVPGSPSPSVGVVTDWRTGITPACNDVLDAGGTVVACVGQGTLLNDIAALAGVAPRPESDEAVPWETRDEPIGLTIAAPDSPFLAIFAGGSYGTPTAARVTARAVLPESLIPPHTHLLRYADGVPAIAIVPGKGKLVIWNLPLDPEASDLAKRPELLALVGELISHTRQDALSWGRSTHPGQPLSWETVETVARADVRLQGESGEAVGLLPSLPGTEAGVVSEPLSHPGLYRWYYRKRVAGYGIVNFAPAESDLRSLGAQQLADTGALRIEGGGRLSRLHAGIPLWPRLLALALSLVAFESLVLWRSDRR
ncbi:MAG: VWA domain-containing protein [Lentisphaerae bacterium]|jgi:hypothetical protein|nr:VWA domain-containing protein [Lentisphaerota bacterium]MBT5604387.1 VWA domain-containing protein [Lentisphaerota bacterium]MBT7055212.1 VWA domain-containing protein [Lentisphaerota bacterium]MBT7843277.1 VWA domain-containing protein [Lentisphaerota bacterium]